MKELVGFIYEYGGVYLQAHSSAFKCITRIQYRNRSIQCIQWRMHSRFCCIHVYMQSGLRCIQRRMYSQCIHTMHSSIFTCGMHSQFWCIQSYSACCVFTNNCILVHMPPCPRQRMQSLCEYDPFWIHCDVCMWIRLNASHVRMQLCKNTLRMHITRNTTLYECARIRIHMVMNTVRYWIHVKCIWMRVFWDESIQSNSVFYTIQVYSMHSQCILPQCVFTSLGAYTRIQRLDSKNTCEYIADRIHTLRILLNTPEWSNPTKVVALIQCAHSHPFPEYVWMRADGVVNRLYVRCATGVHTLQVQNRHRMLPKVFECVGMQTNQRRRSRDSPNR